MAEVIAELLDVSRALVGIAVYSVNAVPIDITVTQYRLLAVVASAGPRTIGEVAALLGVAQSNASRHCDRLERLELQSAGEPGAEGYYYFAADFQPPETGEVLIDLAGDVVPAVVHLFGDFETYLHYAFGEWRAGAD
jgi:hypothetical protein